MSEPSPKAKRVYASGSSIPVIAQRSLKPKQSIKAGQIWLLFRRILVLVAAIVYVKISLEGAFCALDILNGVIDHSIHFDPYQADYINSFAQPDNVHEGDVPTVDKGKLVNQILNRILTPRVNQTLYLHSRTDASLIECSNWTSEATQRVYSSVHLYKLFNEVVRDIAYAVPALVGNEMVLPIVDCSFTGLRNGDKSNMRAFYLMRETNASDPFLITFSLSMQDYRFPDLHQLGATGLLVLSIVSDFTNDKVDHYYALTPGSPFRAAKYDVYSRNGLTNDGFMILESTPTVDEPTKVYHTAARAGVYRKTESEQAHLRNVHWEPSQKPAMALSRWEWQGTYVRRDSWAWVHGLHFIFTADTCINIIVLLIVIYRNKLKGKVWIGDAFVSISKPAVFRALCVLVGWELNGIWTAHKFMLEQGNVMGNVPKLLVFPPLMHADLMLIYLGVVDLVGFVMCERIDPALSMALYEFGFSYRRELATLFPSMSKTIVEFARKDYALGLAYIHPKLTAISPLRFSTIHEMSDFPSIAGFDALFPIFSTLIFLVVYVPVRKIFRRYFPSRVAGSARLSSRPSIEAEAFLSWKSSLTMFEVATGAALQSRVGLVSDYDNCIYIKSMKFASADGVYCNGFVVANNKYLVRTSDVWIIMFIVLTRIRIHDLYVYEIEGYTVQKTARLFYPEMLKWSDLLHLHSMILA